MTDAELRKSLAHRLGLKRLHPALWTALSTVYPEDVEYAKTADEGMESLATIYENHAKVLEMLSDTQQSRWAPPHVSTPPRVEDSLRAQAVYLARVIEANEDPDVKKFRRRFLDGHLLDSKDIPRFLHSPANACFPLQTFQEHGIPTYDHEAKIVEGSIQGTESIVVTFEPSGPTWKATCTGQATSLDTSSVSGWLAIPEFIPVLSTMEADGGPLDSLGSTALGNDSRDSATSSNTLIVAWPNSVLAALIDTTSTVATRYRLGKVAHCLWLVLGGVHPHNPLTSINTVTIPNDANTGDEAERQAPPGGSIVITVQPWVPVDVVATCYRGAQKEALGHANKPWGIRNLVLYLFAGLRRTGTNPPSWQTILDEWTDWVEYWRQNGNYPEWGIDSSWNWRDADAMAGEFRRMHDRLRTGL